MEESAIAETLAEKRRVIACVRKSCEATKSNQKWIQAAEDMVRCGDAMTSGFKNSELSRTIAVLSDFYDASIAEAHAYTRSVFECTHSGACLEHTMRMEAVTSSYLEEALSKFLKFVRSRKDRGALWVRLMSRKSTSVLSTALKEKERARLQCARESGAPLAYIRAHENLLDARDAVLAEIEASHTRTDTDVVGAFAQFVRSLKSVRKAEKPEVVRAVIGSCMREHFELTKAKKAHAIKGLKTSLEGIRRIAEKNSKKK